MNDPIDDRLRQLAREIHDASPEPPPWNQVGLPRTSGAVPRSRWLVAMLVAAAVGLVAVGVVRSTAGHERKPSVPGTSPSVASTTTTTTTTTTTVAVASTVASTTTTMSTTSTTVASTTTTMPTTSTTVAALLTAISVSYRTPPPVLALHPFASVDLPVDPTHPVSLWPTAALDGGRAAIVDGDHHRIVVVEASGRQTVVPLADDLAPFLVSGGHDVVYGIAQRGTPQNAAGAAAIAIALTGPQAGHVITSTEIGILPYTEVPENILGHGKDAVIDRRTGAVVIPYVDTAGGPRSFDVAPPNYRLDTDGTVRADDGTATWAVSVERAPGWPGSDVGDAPPAQIGDGRAIWSTSVGPPLDPTQDIPTPTVPVIVLLEADGTGAWYRLPSGWSLVAADDSGVVFARRVGSTLQLAALPA